MDTYDRQIQSLPISDRQRLAHAAAILSVLHSRYITTHELLEYCDLGLQLIDTAHRHPSPPPTHQHGFTDDTYCAQDAADLP